MTLLLQLTIILLCFIGTAFFAGMETGVIAINRLRLQHLRRQGVPGAKILHRFLKKPDHLLGTTLVGTNVCTVMASVTTASVAVSLLGAWGPPVSGVATTLILLIFCEYLPKAWFQSCPALRSIPLAGVLRFFGYIFYPIGRAVTGIANALIPSGVRKGQKISATITRDDLHYLTREGEQSGMLTARERRMIHGVFELTRKSCLQIMIPADQMISVRVNTPREDILALARTRGFTRLPVYDEEKTRVVGIVNTLDIGADDSGDARIARDYMRPPQFVRAHLAVDDLLPRMRLTRQPMVLVTDEQSRVIGVITLEDVLEEIVGEL